MVLQKRESESGVVWYASALLEAAGARHAFSTRLGGVSEGAFASLNLGNPGGAGVRDEETRIQENYQRLQAAMGVADRERCWVHQVHGHRVLTVRQGAEFENGQPADALVCDDPQRVVAVRVADCVPILLASDDGRVVAAVHAGWRGVVGGVVGAAIDAMRREFDIPSTRLLAAIGPCIGPEAFEVGAEVAEEFIRVFGESAPIQRRVGDKALIDLPEGVRAQLLAAGIPADQIEGTDRCTYRDAAEFFSHRRDNGVTGRMAAVVGVRGKSDER